MRTALRVSPRSFLSIHAPGHEAALLSYVFGYRDDFPPIDTSALAAWQREHIDGGYLHHYVERLRRLYASKDDASGTYVSCPLCPMPLCGVGLETPAAVDASRAHAYAHLMAYRTQRQAAEPDHPAPILLVAGSARGGVDH